MSCTDLDPWTTQEATRKGLVVPTPWTCCQCGRMRSETKLACSCGHKRCDTKPSPTRFNREPPL